MRVVFAGTPEAAVPSLDALLGSSHDLVAVLTRPDARVGRGRKPAESPVAARAQAAGVPVLKPARLRDPAVGDELRALEPDCVPVVAYGALVPPALLDLPAHGWVNLHFSLLPAWRGAAPVQHAVLHGDDLTGATTFRLDEGLDTGPVYGVLTEPVRPTDTSGELLDRLARAGAGLLVATLDGIERGELTAVPQSPHGVSLAPKLVPADARVDWNAPALRVDRLVRACTPAPGAWTTLRGDRVGLGPVQPLDGDAAVLASGQVRVLRNRVLVGCGNGLAVELGEVRPAGRKAMAAADWARGLRDVDGERLV
ncbi:MAG: methionyl-tRNA formyltransferase [Actinomycetota bacterium]|jgi:methionyl-tRNA formyltransferase|nr:methionyl-tRNA formyltransferase [Actinomycetota bacterium]